MNFGVSELLIVLGIVLLLFGSTRLPKLARSFGQAKREFEKGEDPERAPKPDPAKGPPRDVPLHELDL